eukprot:3941284-Rhodomonas_salina.9
MPRVRMKSYESGESDQIHFDARKVAAVMAHHSVSAIFDEVLKKGRDPEVTSWGAAADRFCFGGALSYSSLDHSITRSLDHPSPDNPIIRHPSSVIRLPSWARSPIREKRRRILEHKKRHC